MSDAPLRLLAVDDWPDVAESLAEIARLWGHAAEAVCDGRAAVARAAAFRPDVVLLDLAMPGLSGLAIARLLRADPRNAGVYLVALSGYSSLKGEALQAGCDRFLLKPPALADLAALLAERAARRTDGPAPSFARSPSPVPPQMAAR